MPIEAYACQSRPLTEPNADRLAITSPKASPSGRPWETDQRPAWALVRACLPVILTGLTDWIEGNGA
ncbi:hypothetical protein NPX13_g3376 [Xylaria arbuscula]|uniref:Uncharacterized protein n=1 Tax=Xylaria arbuscula TaxID=114810 RepID=A0A9W8TQ58_9PEZI|nr:hypothetical protein NPX13_g3376 [Xylaria arbuscula]